jgi:peptide/nickel transport system permease protein
VKGGWLDRFLQVLSVVGGAIPQFIVAIVLVFTFAVGLRIFPATGIVPPSEDVGLWAQSLVLPVTAILVGTAMSGAMQIRGSMLVELRKEYVATLRTRGISEFSVLYKHALRNAAAPGLIGLGILTVAMLGGTVIIERVFALPGLGMLVTSTTTTGDIPALMGCVTITVVIVTIVNLLIDLLMGILNPKVRL